MFGRFGGGGGIALETSLNKLINVLDPYYPLPGAMEKTGCGRNTRRVWKPASYPAERGLVIAPKARNDKIKVKILKNLSEN